MLTCQREDDQIPQKKMVLEGCHWLKISICNDIRGESFAKLRKNKSRSDKAKTESAKYPQVFQLTELEMLLF